VTEIPLLPFDIIEPAMPPLPPPDHSWAVAAAAVLAVALMLSLILHWRRTRWRRLARRKLARARDAFASGGLNGQAAAFAIAEALRTAYRVSHLKLTDETDPRWREFIVRLDELRYRRPDQAIDAGELFSEAAHWLRRKAPC
jgi:hypothetical protein